MEDIHGLTGDQADDVGGFQDVKGDAKAARNAIVLGHHSVGRVCEVAFRAILILQGKGLHRIDGLLFKGKCVGRFGFGEAAGGRSKVLRKGRYHRQWNMEIKVGVLFQIIYRGCDIL